MSAHSPFCHHDHITHLSQVITISKGCEVQTNEITWLFRLLKSALCFFSFLSHLFQLHGARL